MSLVEYYYQVLWRFLKSKAALAILKLWNPLEIKVGRSSRRNKSVSVLKKLQFHLLSRHAAYCLWQSVSASNSTKCVRSISPHMGLAKGQTEFNLGSFSGVLLDPIGCCYLDDQLFCPRAQINYRNL